MMEYLLQAYLLVISVIVASSDAQVWPNSKLFERKRRPLSIDGAWSNWQSWSGCFKNSPDVVNFYPPWENFIVQSRNRSCDAPKPLYGGKDCDPPSHRFRQCSCKNALGMQNKQINTSQVTSSAYYKNYNPDQGRLGDNYLGWCAGSAINYLRKQYIQVEFETFATLTAIATVGIKEGRVTRYRLQYSLNGKSWNDLYQDNDKSEKIFKGNLRAKKIQRNNFSSHHEVMKYLRVIPTNSYGSRPCLKMELYGCIFTCGELLTAPFGEIVARSLSEIDQNCLWRIEVLNTTALTFDFNIFYILCEHGHLDFHDGEVSFPNSPLLKRVCLKNEDDEPPPLMLNSNKVWLNFVSNSSSSEVGFNIRYFSVCNQLISLEEGEEKQIMSPNYPEKYFDNLKCTWTVLSPKSTNKLQISTLDFSVESSQNSTSSCIDDVVQILSEDDGKQNVIGYYCNNKKPPSNLIVNSKKLIIKFTSDLIASDKGFSFNILSGDRVLTTEKSPTFFESTLPHDKIIPTSGNSKHRSNNTREQVNEESDDTWTIIIISAFSAFAVVLLCAVVGMNVRRYINSRNEVEAQCAKVREQEKKKKALKMKKEEKSNSLTRNLIPKPPSPVKIKKSPENETMLKDNFTENNHQTAIDLEQETRFLSSPDSIDPHNSNENVEEDRVDDGVSAGECSSYDSSSPQIHSPSKSVGDLNSDKILSIDDNLNMDKEVNV